jgi:hypothetical protein
LYPAETELNFSTVDSVMVKFTFTMLIASQLSVPWSSGKPCYVPVPWQMGQCQEAPNLQSLPSDIRTPPHRRRASCQCLSDCLAVYSWHAFVPLMSSSTHSTVVQECLLQLSGRWTCNFILALSVNNVTTTL